MELINFLSPIAILGSAAGSWYLANRAIKSNEDTSRIRATFDYLSRLSWDQDYIQAKNTFLEIKAGSKKLRAVAEEYEAAKKPNGNALNDDDVARIVEHHSAIRNVLNEYEAMATGVKCGALDENLLKLNIRQQMIEHVEACRDFIKYTRDNSGFTAPERIWREISLLVEKWRQEEQD